MNDFEADGSPAVNTCRVNIAPDHACFPGHFPGQPILPGVLLLERVLSMAQACLKQPLDHCTVFNVKFLASVLPGDRLDLRLAGGLVNEYKFTVHIVKSGGVDGMTGAENVLACSGQLRTGTS